jgi:diguanylate cyclase (GGDEF)-like protein
MPSHERLAASVHRFAGVAAVLTVAVGVAVGLGWIFDVPMLKSVAPGLVAMKANTAVGFVLAGTALWLLHDAHPSRRERRGGALLAGVIVVVALLTLAEYVFGIDLGIDHLFRDPGVSLPGRPSPHTALAFLLVGSWLIALAREPHASHRISDILSVLACVIVLQAAIGYVFGVKDLYGISKVTGMALHSMITFVILCLGILAARPRQSFTGVITSIGAGGHIARRLTPAVLLGPLVIGYLCLKGQQDGLFGTRDAVTILVGVVVVLFAGVVVYSCLSINRADAIRRTLEKRLQELAERDPLTSLFNRRRFRQELDQQLALAERYGTDVALIMIDLDGLKQTNDTYGHRAGDRLLVGVAEILNRELRTSDICSRISGDEFAALLPNADSDGAQATATRLVTAMRDSTWQIDDHTITSTLSAGIALTDMSRADATVLATAADRALYQAKDAGGDQHVLAAIPAVPAGAEARGARRDVLA